MSSEQSVEQPSIVERLVEKFKDDPEYLKEGIALLEGELAVAQERERGLVEALWDALVYMTESCTRTGDYEYAGRQIAKAEAALRAVGALEEPHAE